MSKGVTWIALVASGVALAGTAGLALKYSGRPEQLPIPNFAEVENKTQAAAQKAEEASQKATEALKGANEASAEVKNVTSALDRLTARVDDVAQKTEDAAKQAHTHERSTVVEITYNPVLNCENPLRYAKASGLLDALYKRDAQNGKAELWGPDNEVARLFVAKRWDANKDDILSQDEAENAINANKGLEMVITVDGNTKFSVARSPKFHSEEDKRAYLQLREKAEAVRKVPDIEWMYRVVAPYLNSEGFITGDAIKKLEDLMRLK